MTNYRGIEPDPQPIPEREDWLAECPACGGLACGASPEEALEDWRGHGNWAHQPSDAAQVLPTLWTVAEMQEALLRLEAEARRAGFTDNSVHTYVDHSARFVRWLAGEFTFHSGR